MSRPVVLSNGEMHVGLNKYGLVHDFYFPYVGQENHTAAKNLRHRVGVWVDGKLSWLDDGSWDVGIAYHDDVLVSRITATHAELSVAIEFDDFVDSSSTSFMRNIHVINHAEQERVERRAVLAELQHLPQRGADHGGDSVLRVCPAGPQGSAACADLSETGRRHHYHGRCGPCADHGSPCEPDSGVFQYSSR